MRAPAALTGLLRRYEPDVQTAAIALRSVVLDETGPCHETVLQLYRNNVVSILYSTTEKQMKDNICLIVVYRDHVNLLFPRGADLKDPRGLLEGTGKAMRHVKIFSVADVGRPGVRALVSQAKKRPGLGKPARPLRKVTTTLSGKAKQAATPAEQPARPRLF
jgi:hypothetical protein